MKREEVLKERISSQSRDLFDRIIEQLIVRGVLSRKNGQRLNFKSNAETLINFASSLVWPMVDSYYVTFMFTLSMMKNKGVEASMINKRVQWLSECLYNEGKIKFFEACNQESIKNAVL